MNEINPPSEEIGEENWFTKARLAVQGGKKLVPFRFELKVHRIPRPPCLT